MGPRSDLLRRPASSPAWRGRVRIMTDSRNLLNSLKTPPRQEEQRVRLVSKILGETAAR